jgi:DNA (cytosine-5)-methyltransferase 1
MEYGKFRLIDLFCGCGGMTEGFADTGRFSSVFANDFNHWAVKSYKANFDPEGQHSEEGDIISIVEKKPHLIPKADVVIGGPPSRIISLLLP